MQPDYNEIVDFGPSYSNRWGTRVRNAYWHTEQGNGTADSLAAYCNNPANGVGYHYIIRDGQVRSIVDTDYASWSVLDANPSSINYCFAGSFAEWSREQWLEREGDIAIAAWLTVQDCHKYGFSTEVVAPPYRWADGISDHKYVTQVLGIGTHTDVGDQFPWDKAAYFVDVYTGMVDPTPPPPPPVNLIDQEAEAASAWIGARITEGENVAPDGEGRWAQFENAYIYWHPNLGAYAIPTAVFETYAEHGWEAGELGYPTGRHTVLDGGDVQGFERGAIYRRYGEPGHVVTGMIRAYWNRSGFETGTFGWPVSDETREPDFTFQNFEHGRITWSPSGAVGTHQRGGEWDEILTEGN